MISQMILTSAFSDGTEFFGKHSPMPQTAPFHRRQRRSMRSSNSNCWQRRCDRPCQQFELRHVIESALRVVPNAIARARWPRSAAVPRGHRRRVSRSKMILGENVRQLLQFLELRDSHLSIGENSTNF
jgi:hypothetical protein